MWRKRPAVLGYSSNCCSQLFALVKSEANAAPSISDKDSVVLRIIDVVALIKVQ